MRILFAVLVLCGASTHAAAPVASAKLQDFNKEIDLPSGTKIIALCSATDCGVPVSMAGPSRRWCNTVMFQPPTGSPIGCYDIGIAPVVTPPLVALPSGVTKLADVGGPFQIETQSLIAMCDASATTCTTKRLFAPTGTGENNGRYSCSFASSNFGSLTNAAGCYSFPVPLAKPGCLPDASAAAEFSIGATTYADFPGYVVWREKPSCGNGVYARLFTFMEGLQFAAMKVYESDTKYSAYLQTTTSTPVSADKQAFLEAKKTAFEATLPPRGTSPVVTYWVQSVSAACDLSGAVTTACTRPIYKKSNSGGLGTAVQGVRVRGKTPCDASVRIGTTSYYKVPSVTTTVDLYAACTVASP